MTSEFAAKICVFAGPSVSAETVNAVLPDAAVLPPAAQGDVYRAARARPAALAIIDGYFERVPAVWHKEILWALHRGIPVYGAASMGALRAAEMATFGMIGVGWIFEQFASGALTDDDEVAVAHAGTDDDYRVGSEAMVNFRQTLAAAVAAGVLTDTDATVLIQLAKARFYPERSWPQLFQDAESRGLRDCALALRDWLPRGRVDQKQQDALALLRRLHGTRFEPVQVPWTFHHTVYWEDLVRNAGPSKQAGSQGPIVLDLVLDELRLDHGAFAEAYRAGLLRALAIAEAARADLYPDGASVRELANDRCQAMGMTDQAAFAAWLRRNHLDLAEFNELIRADEQVELVAIRYASEAISQLLHHLRVIGRFEGLVARAERKQQVLGAAGLDNPALDDTGMDEDTLYRSWFGRWGLPIPPDVDKWARTVGYRDEDAFRRVLGREAVYLALEDS